MNAATSLRALKKGLTARVTGFASNSGELEIKLREFGFAEGSQVELLGRGLLGGTPLSIRLNRTVVALRRDEAEAVQVSVDA